MSRIRIILLVGVLALPSIMWPVSEWGGFRLDGESHFLPYFNQIDVVYPLCWSLRQAEDSRITDLSIWEHRHDSGSPGELMRYWPWSIAQMVSVFGFSSWWFMVWILHGFWILAIARLTRTVFECQWGSCLLIATLTVYAVFPLGINLFFFGLELQNWSPFFAYENFRVYPSLISIVVSTAALLCIFQYRERGGRGNLILAALLTGISPWGRPFDWMVIMTLLGLSLMESCVSKNRETRLRDMWALGGSVLSSIPFLILYLLWMKQDLTIHEQGLFRGVMQAKEATHFLKYAVFTLFWIASVWTVLWVGNRMGRAKLSQMRIRWLLLLIAASFLPYFQFLPTGKTISSYQYFFIYFSFPFIFWVAVSNLIRALRLANWKMPVWIALSLIAAVACQGMLGLTPDWLMNRTKYPSSDQAIYQAIGQTKDAVVLSPNITECPSQSLILESGAWSFVPQPMMFAYASMASTEELLERQLLSKLLLTGTIQDLAPMFASEGLPHFSQYEEQSGPDTRFWMERLGNCPAQAYFLFHPTKSRATFHVRKMNVPPSLLKSDSEFVYFEKPCRDVFERVSSLEAASFERVLDEILQKYRLTHILLSHKTSKYEKRLEGSPQRIKMILSNTQGKSLWEIQK